MSCERQRDCAAQEICVDKKSLTAEETCSGHCVCMDRHQYYVARSYADAYYTATMPTKKDISMIDDRERECKGSSRAQIPPTRPVVLMYSDGVKVEEDMGEI